MCLPAPNCNAKQLEAASAAALPGEGQLALDGQGQLAALGLIFQCKWKTQELWGMRQGDKSMQWAGV